MYNIPCKKCSGKGAIPYFRLVNGGECFDCNGSGVQEVSKEEYSTHLENEKFRKQVEKKGAFVVYNKTADEFEYFYTENDVIKKYGSFYSFGRRYAGYSAYFFDDHPDLVLKDYYGNDSFMHDFRRQKIIDEQKKQKEWIEILNGWLTMAIENKKHADEIQELKIMIKEAEHKLQMISYKQLKKPITQQTN
ncbi:hypothetical protein [Bacillus haynesii]|uniref:hypothetical protein n=1 Tax=Bacillus haynesii TaxID=1925021 RepID=UPI002280360B|nr:hypothetical protein [Bacillus haynesii]MCY8539409.1 hypothetical protein [Bacillus haynesii]